VSQHSVVGKVLDHIHHRITLDNSWLLLVDSVAEATFAQKFKNQLGSELRVVYTICGVYV